MLGGHHLSQAEWSSARDSRHLMEHTEHSPPRLLQRQMGGLALVFIPPPSGASVTEELFRTEESRLAEWVPESSFEGAFLNINVENRFPMLKGLSSREKTQ